MRNQIDYILIDKKYLQFVTDARSYNNKNTQTDHNLVVMNMKIEFSKLNKPNKSPTPRINEENFKKPELAEKYKEEIIKRQNSAERKVCTDNNEKWTRLLEECKEVDEEVLGVKENNKEPEHDKEISSLKDRRHNLKVNIDGCNSKEVRAKLEHERKGIKSKITKQLKANEEKALDEKMQRLESLKDDNSKYFYVMRDIQNMNSNKKSAMLVKDVNGNVPGSNEGKIKVIEDYFKSTLVKCCNEGKVKSSE